MDHFRRLGARAALFAGLLGSALIAAEPPPTGDFKESYNTLYNYLIVERKGSMVEMRSVARNLIYRESAVDLSDPEKLIVPYVEGLFSAAIFQPKPTDVLMIGLGGGSFNRVFARAFPQATLLTVEIDGKVEDLATRFMAFQASDRNRVKVADGRTFVRRNKGKKQFDWVMVDAYKGNCVPPHLKTLEFYQEVGRCVAPGGVAVFNLQDDCKLFDFDLATLAAAFPQVIYFKVPGAPNSIAIASQAAEPSLRKLLAGFDSRALPEPLRKRVDFFKLIRECYSPKAAPNAQVMTDDFAPAEYYRVVQRGRDDS